jgi:two-component system NarL family response regulator
MGEAIVVLSSQLTMKEMEILSLVASGKSNKEIAVILHISQNTVRHHVHQVLTKLKCSSRSQAAALAIRQGLVAPGDKVTIG